MILFCPQSVETNLPSHSQSGGYFTCAGAAMFTVHLVNTQLFCMTVGVFP